MNSSLYITYLIHFMSLSFFFLSVVSGRTASPTTTSMRIVATLWKPVCWSEWRQRVGTTPPAACSCPSSVRRRWTPVPAPGYHTETSTPLWKNARNQSVVGQVFKKPSHYFPIFSEHNPPKIWIHMFTSNAVYSDIEIHPLQEELQI